MALKDILVPYDFSDCATDALRVSAKIAHMSGATLHLVHVYEVMTEFHTSNQQIRDEIQAKFDEIPNLPFLQGVPMKRFMLAHMGLTEIFRNKHLRSMDLVIMGSNGAKGLGGMVGSNTQRVVRVAPMPVLVIKHAMSDFDVQDLVYASTFTPNDIEKFSAFKPILDLFNPKVHLLKVNTPSNFQRSEDTFNAIDEFLQRYELRKFTSTIYNDMSIEAGILNFARSIDADMIAMATHGRKGFFRVVNGSLTEEIVNRTNFPILSIKL